MWLPDAVETITGALALAKLEGNSRELIARLLELEEKLTPSWTLPNKK